MLNPLYVGVPGIDFIMCNTIKILLTLLPSHLALKLVNKMQIISAQ